MILVVTGGRDYTDRNAIFWALDVLHAHHPVTFMSLGDARGADAVALEWAKRNGIHGVVHRARWDMLGKSAGHERNGRMLATALARAAEAGEPVKLLACPGGHGTRDCVRQALAREILVVDMDELLHQEIGDEAADDGSWDGLQRDWGDL